MIVCNILTLCSLKFVIVNHTLTGQPGLSCDAYCASFSTDTTRFAKGECTSLVGVAHKSVCKCYEKTASGDLSGPPRGPNGLAGAACQTAYMGQLLNCALKTLFIPGK